MPKPHAETGICPEAVNAKVRSGWRPASRRAGHPARRKKLQVLQRLRSIMTAERLKRAQQIASVHAFFCRIWYIGGALIPRS